MASQGGQVPSLYEWLGGAKVLEALMVKFYQRVSSDELLRPLFGEMSPDHPKHVAEFVGEVAGGPQEYTASRGGHATMLAHHFGRNISEAQRRRWVSLLLDSADEVGLPEDPEFRSALGRISRMGIAAGCHEFEIASGDCGGSGNRDAEVGLGRAWRAISA